jgi:hypothetical protein
MKVSSGLDGSLAVVLVTAQVLYLVDFLFHEIENSSAPMNCWKGVLYMWWGVPSLHGDATRPNLQTAKGHQ